MSAGVDGVLVLAAGLALGGPSALALLPTLAGAIAILCLLPLSLRSKAFLAAVFAVGLSFSFARAQVAIRRYEVAREVAQAALGPPARCSARATVVSSPVRLTREGSGETTLRWDAALDEVDCDGARARHGVSRHGNALRRPS